MLVLAGSAMKEKCREYELDAMLEGDDPPLIAIAFIFIPLHEKVGVVVPDA